MEAQQAKQATLLLSDSSRFVALHQLTDLEWSAYKWWKAERDDMASVSFVLPQFLNLSSVYLHELHIATGENQ